MSVAGDAVNQCPDRTAGGRTRRDDLLAGLRVRLLMCSVFLLLMLEDDAAMIALMFC
jgi:hypothetical protein